jgi:hypothetical protein
MASGVLLPAGGVSGLAVGGWLMHLAGMSTRAILERSSALFFLTSAASLVATLVVYGLSPIDAAAAVLVYHAIALRVPGLGGLLGLVRLRRAPSIEGGSVEGG